MSAPEKKLDRGMVVSSALFQPGKQLGVMSQMLAEKQIILKALIANPENITPEDVKKRISSLSALHHRFNDLCKNISHTESYQKLNNEFDNLIKQYASLLPTNTHDGPA